MNSNGNPIENGGSPTGETWSRLLDELRETWLDEWRSRWEAEHPDEMDAAIKGDSSYGGHPYWTEPTEELLVLSATAACRVLADHFMHRDGPGYVTEELLTIGAEIRPTAVANATSRGSTE